MFRAFILACAAFMVQAWAAEGEGQSQAGVVKAITGDLAYVSGLNAPLGSQLQVDHGPSSDGATLAVIKKLDNDVLVARVIEENGQK